jgi:hypothetical protein
VDVALASASLLEFILPDDHAYFLKKPPLDPLPWPAALEM